MLLRSFAGDAQVVPILDPLAAAADEDRSSEILDCVDVGHVLILFCALAQADGSTNSLSLQQSDALDDHGDLDTPVAVTDSTTAVAADDDANWKGWEFTPSKRFIQMLVDKDAHLDTNELAVALLYRKERPVTHADGVTLGTAEVDITSLGAA